MRQKTRREIRDKVTGEMRLILKGPALRKLRMTKCAEAHGMCQCGQLKNPPRECGLCAPWPSGVIPMPWEGQLAHWPPKRMGNGFGSDDRAYWLRGECHDRLDNRNQKVVPAKRA